MAIILKKLCMVQWTTMALNPGADDEVPGSLVVGLAMLVAI